MLHAIEMAELILQRLADAADVGDIERLALERAFEIMSEASRHIPDTINADHLQREWRLLAGLGNILLHDYEKIEPAVLIAAANDELPPLRTVLLQIKASLAHMVPQLELIGGKRITRQSDA